LIAWTGEIKPIIRKPWERKNGELAKNAGVANGQIDEVEKSLEEKRKELLLEEADKELVSLTKADKQKFTDEVNAANLAPGGKKYEMVPIWTLEDTDGKRKNAASETPERQGRFRKYAEQGRTLLVQSNPSPVAIITLCPLDRDRW
jgi:hypothetical protein